MGALTTVARRAAAAGVVLLLTASLVGATRLAPLRRALVPTAERLPGVFAAAVNSLAKEA